MSLGDNEYPQDAPLENVNADPNSIHGYKYSPYGLYETPATMNSSWGFKYYDQNWLTADAIRENRERLKGMGVNYLLNMGPDGLGRIPSFCQEALRQSAVVKNR